jgi:hypothetical protein
MKLVELLVLRNVQEMRLVELLFSRNVELSSNLHTDGPIPLWSSALDYTHIALFNSNIYFHIIVFLFFCSGWVK